MSIITQTAIENLYNSFRNIHDLTGCVHKNIYYKNILQINQDKLCLNNFELTAVKECSVSIERNSHFASDGILNCKTIEFEYNVCEGRYLELYIFPYFLWKF
jgi:hypothetical protein